MSHANRGKGWGGALRSGAINSDAANIINGNVLNIKAPADREAASPLRQEGTDELTRVSQGEALKGGGRNSSPPVGVGSKTRRLMECFGPTTVCLPVLFIRQHEIIAFVYSGYRFLFFLVVFLWEAQRKVGAGRP